ncbi:MAG: hypothetical protein IH840_07480, partial [Candidatus Heimdallarchaeota archaeon]|nr:hypothetical protein [Candidatus Heimdallarchaeota archaeon]
MECQTCVAQGKRIERDILFNCPVCKTRQCEAHINNHPHNNPMYPQSSGVSPGQRWTASLAELGLLNYQPTYREPTPDEYEAFLRSNPRVLTSGKESIDLAVGLLLIGFVFGFQPLRRDPSNWPYILILTLIIGPAF